MKTLESRLDKYILTDRAAMASAMAARESRRHLIADRRRVQRTAALAGVRFVPRDWLALGGTAEAFPVRLSPQHVSL